MPQIVYVNGRYLPRHQAVVSIEDRGYQFSDGVYQVIALIKGKLIDEDPHLDALDYSLKELNIHSPMSRKAIKAIARQLISVNKVENAHVYIQVTRGVQKRAHVYKENLQSSLIIVITPCRIPELTQAVPEISVVTAPDLRWARPDIKSLVLLPNILSKKYADSQGAYDVWQVRNGMITEGGSSNAWIVNKKGHLQTHPANGLILNGITRQTIVRLINQANLKFIEEPFTPEEAKAASEAFMTAAFSLVKAITRIDNVKIGAGVAGPVTQQIAYLYGKYINEISS